jgi:hypothetical protein
LWDGQEVQKNDHDWCYTNTNPLRRDSDGDGIGDYFDDEDEDGLPNGAEWKYLSARPYGWCRPLVADSDRDNVLDGQEVFGNPANKDQTSLPTNPDTDGDALTDDIDPRTWIYDHLPFTRIRDVRFPSVVSKGVPFRVEGHLEYNTTASGNWRRINVPVEVSVYIKQGNEEHIISDTYTSGKYGVFVISVTLGDDIKAGSASVIIKASPINGQVEYLPCTWSE